MGIIREINGRLVTATCWVLLSITQGPGHSAPSCRCLCISSGLGTGRLRSTSYLPREQCPVPGLYHVPWLSLGLLPVLSCLQGPST